MSDTYQTKLAINGRNPGDNTLEVYRTAGTDCAELAATYRNQHFWLPTGKNWFTRKWISGEDQDDGFKQCVCVNGSVKTIAGCTVDIEEAVNLPYSYIVEFLADGDPGASANDVSAMYGARVPIYYRCTNSGQCEFYKHSDAGQAYAVIGGSCWDIAAPSGTVVCVVILRIAYDTVANPGKYTIQCTIGAGVSGEDSTDDWSLVTSVFDTLAEALAAIESEDGMEFERGGSSGNHFPTGGTIYAVT